MLQQSIVTKEAGKNESINAGVENFGDEEDQQQEEKNYYCRCRLEMVLDYLQ